MSLLSAMPVTIPSYNPRSLGGWACFATRRCHSARATSDGSSPARTARAASTRAWPKAARASQSQPSSAATDGPVASKATATAGTPADDTTHSAAARSSPIRSATCVSTLHPTVRHRSHLSPQRPKLPIWSDTDPSPNRMGYSLVRIYAIDGSHHRNRGM